MGKRLPSKETAPPATGKATVLWFGQYEGCRLGAVPVDYLKWIVGERAGSDRFKRLQTDARELLPKERRDRRYRPNPKRKKPLSKEKRLRKEIRKDKRLHHVRCDRDAGSYQRRPTRSESEVKTG